MLPAFLQNRRKDIANREGQLRPLGDTAQKKQVCCEHECRPLCGRSGGDGLLLPPHGCAALFRRQQIHGFVK